MGLIDQINNIYEYKTKLTKEFLFNYTNELDANMKENYPCSSHQGEARKIMEELLEYNTDTSIPHPEKDEDIVRAYTKDKYKN